MDFGTIAAISAVVGVIIAILALIKQSKDAHTSLGIKLLRDLDKEFDSEEMRQYRMALSNLCIKREEGAEIPSIEIISHFDVLNFFDTLGMFLKRNILDLEFTWARYSYWVIRYWEVLEKDINAYRKLEKDNVYWEDFEYLYKQIVKFDSQRLKIHRGKLAKDEIRQFLSGESKLRKKIVRC